MAGTNSSGVHSRVDHLGRIAPASTDSDPNADELLRRVRRPRSALTRAVGTARRWHDEEIEAAYAERDQQFAERVDFEIAIGSAA